MLELLYTGEKIPTGYHVKMHLMHTGSVLSSSFILSDKRLILVVLSLKDEWVDSVSAALASTTLTFKYNHVCFYETKQTEKQAKQVEPIIP